MTDPRTPRTEAGRALWERLRPYYPPLEYDGWSEWIAAIEAEASPLGSSERLAAAPAVVADIETRHKKFTGWLDRHPGLDPASDLYRAHLDREVLLTILAADPALSDPDAERQRAIGEAVERLPRFANIARVGDEYIVLTFPYRDEMSASSFVGTGYGKAATLPDAIAAALPAAQEAER
jgi:hypothetical protein